jgi:hypothetical protein
VPGGLSASLAVGVFPAVAVAFLTLIGVRPSDPFFEPLDEFSGWTFAVGVATALVGLLVWWLTRFSFVLAVAVGAILVSAQLLTPVLRREPERRRARGDGARDRGGPLRGRRLRRRLRTTARGVLVRGARLLQRRRGLVYLTVEPGGDPTAAGSRC